MLSCSLTRSTSRAAGLQPTLVSLLCSHVFSCVIYSLSALRSINIIFGLATFCELVSFVSVSCQSFVAKYAGLLYLIFANQRNMPPLTALLHTLVLVMSPVHFFFSFLYYTDSASTFTVLMCYFLAQPYTKSVVKISQVPHLHRCVTHNCIR